MRSGKGERASVTREALTSSTLCVFGHFGDINIGNESTLQSLLCSLRCHYPNIDITCICSDPLATHRRYGINAVSMSGTVSETFRLCASSRMTVLRKLIFGVPIEIYRWVEAFRSLKGTLALIVAGTGLLTDAYGLRQWGPYTLFKWCLLARLRGGKVFFLSVGAGPIFGRLGAWLVRLSLALAQFRSYRDGRTKEYLASIGVDTKADMVFPDLAFSLPESMMPKAAMPAASRRTVGLGLMAPTGRLTPGEWYDSVHLAYLESLAVFVKWLIEHDYDVRLLIGDVCDIPVIGELRNLLMRHSVHCEAGRLVDAPIRSVEDLLSELARTDAVVATRFHNVLLALLLHKPVVAISFHQKCTSLMTGMGLTQYCEDIRHLDSKRLIELFCDVEENARELEASIKRQVDQCREAVEAQYGLIATEMLSALGNGIK